MIGWFAALLGLLIVGSVVLLVLGWGERLSCIQRLGLSALAAGLVLAAPARWGAGGVGAGDVLFLAGILTSLIGTHGRAVWRRVDGLDGAQDGRVNLAPWTNGPRSRKSR